jgi:hypothetical protein
MTCAPSSAFEADGEEFSVSLDAPEHRVSVATKFGYQVLSPSSENDCSTLCESGVISDHTNRTKIDRPLNDS